jgi:protein ImuB
MRRIACIRFNCKVKNANCKLQIDEPDSWFPRSAWEPACSDAPRRPVRQRVCRVGIAHHKMRGFGGQCPPYSLQSLLEHCGRYSPIVGLEPTDPQSILLDITGLAHLFGGEEAWAAAICGDFAQRGLSIRLAIADTIGAAWAAAHYCKMQNAKCKMQSDGPTEPICSLQFAFFNLHLSPLVILPFRKSAAFLRPLPIKALRLPEKTTRLLGELGITRIEQVEALPREELSSRFGPVLLQRMDQAFGRLDEPVLACPIRPMFAAEWSPEHPTSRRETIDAALEHLTGRVAAMLACHGRGALRLEYRLDCHETATIGRGFTNQDGGCLRMSVGLFQPTVAAGHLFPLVQLQLERLRIPAPVTGVRVEAALTAPLEPRRQATLFDFVNSRHGECEPQFAALVERLSSRLGREAVLGVRLRPEAQPELSWHYDPLVERPRRRARKTLPGELPPRPLRLLPRPLALRATSIAPDGPPLGFHFAGQQHDLAQTCGPERIETGWWRGRPVGRDYFRVETVAGRRFWLFRRLRDGKWFLHGVFE